MIEIMSIYRYRDRHSRCISVAISVSLYLWLLSGVPPGLVVLCQQQLLVQHVHPLLPLDVQRGTHPQGCLIGWLGALTTRDLNNTLIGKQKHTSITD